MSNWTSLPQPPLHVKELWAHQRGGYWFAINRPATMLACGMGTGKSAIAASLLANWNCKRVLVLCPSSVRSVWRRELAKHMPVPHNAVILDRGSITKRTEIADKAWNETSDMLVVVVNYEASWRQPFGDWCLARDWDCVVLDESHSGGTKTHGSKTQRHTEKLGTKAKRRLCLTGTPLSQQPMDAWGQYAFLQPEIFGPWREFKDRYYAARHHRIRKSAAKINELINEKWYGDPEFARSLHIIIPEWKWPGIYHVKEFNRKLEPITFQCRSDDVLDLPPLMIEERYGRMGNEARRIYEQIENDLYADLGDARLSVLCHLSKLLRLQQVTSGFLPDDQGNIHNVDTRKAELLRELLEATVGERMVVFCRFVHDLDVIRATTAALGRRYGEISQRRKDGLSDQGTMADNVDVCGAQLQSASLGIDLTGARYAAVYSPSFSLAEWDQALKRVHRPGQAKPVVIYRLIIEASIDSTVHAAITARKDVVTHILNDLRRRQGALA